MKSDSLKPLLLALTILLVGALTLNLVTGYVAHNNELFGTFRQNSDINLVQNSNASSCNITSVLYPDSTFVIQDIVMTQRGTEFNYTLSSAYSSELGGYTINGDCDGEVWTYKIRITPTGEELGLLQGLIPLAQFGVMFLFFAIGMAFPKEKWKLRTAFFVFSLFMAVITLNSAKVIASQSASLGTMGTLGLILGIVVISFMVVYMLVYYTLEVFNYFKKKKQMRWEIPSRP